MPNNLLDEGLIVSSNGNTRLLFAIRRSGTLWHARLLEDCSSQRQTINPPFRLELPPRPLQLRKNNVAEWFHRFLNNGNGNDLKSALMVE